MTIEQGKRVGIDRFPNFHKTGRELAQAYHYLQQQIFKVFIGFIRQLAVNYREG